MTSRGVPWGVLTFDWISGQEVRCPLFPVLWAVTAPLAVGHTYRVVGTVSFRDGTPVIGIVAIATSAGWRQAPARPPGVLPGDGAKLT